MYGQTSRQTKRLKYDSLFPVIATDQAATVTLSPDFILDTSHPYRLVSPSFRFIIKVFTDDFLTSVSSMTQEEKTAEVEHSRLAILREARMTSSDSRNKTMDKRLASASKASAEQDSSKMCGISLKCPTVNPESEGSTAPSSFRYFLHCDVKVTS